ncbi:MAG: ribonuclease P protein component [Bacteroidales bacterium]|nr:ribonuclease P protein component [Bacteroidales bacterium]
MELRADLPKSQRIYKQTAIQSLFEEGKGFSLYPFRVVVHLYDAENQEDAIPRILVSVSKKRFHHAVKRNRVKRLIREGWRKNKQQLLALCQSQNKTLDVAFVYTATIILKYNEVEDKIKEVVERLKERL